MNGQEIEQLMQAAYRRLREAFKSALAKQQLLHLLEYSQPQFMPNVRTQQYTYRVDILFEIKLEKNQYWESTDRGKQLVSIDKKTGEKSIIISNSYQGMTIYESQLDFQSQSDIVVIHPINITAIKSKIHLKPPSILGFFSQKELPVVNQYWKELFQ